MGKFANLAADFEFSPETNVVILTKQLAGSGWLGVFPVKRDNLARSRSKVLKTIGRSYDYKYKFHVRVFKHVKILKYSYGYYAYYVTLITEI